MKPLRLSKLGLAPNRRLVGTVAAAAGVAVCAWRARAPLTQGVIDDTNKPKLKLPGPLVDAVAGALGEVAQILVLYPLDTVKVRCQASGETAAVVVKRLLRRGVGFKLLQKLYAGALGAAACAVFVGAVHFASYEGSRKAFLKLAIPRRDPVHASPPPATSPGPETSQPSDSVDQNSPTHVPSSAFTAASAFPAPAAASMGTAASATAAHPDTDDGRVTRAVVTFAAAAVAAVATALVESPVELFRHNAQAGFVQPNFMREMATTVRREGVGGLYWGFLPHCFEAWPHDISELATYGFMREFQASASRPGSRHHGWMSGVSEQAWDLATGAASGAAAVVVSMPFDTVKTYLQTHGADLSGRGLLGSAALFVKSGRRIVARKGLAGLYVGVTPRLFQQVPSAMVCWWTIAAFKRWADPYTQSDEEGLAGACSHGGGGHGGRSGGGH